MTEERACIIMDKNGVGTVGTFHRWADSYFQDEANNRMPLTVAIVEGADGKMYTCEPTEIRFTGPRTAHEALERMIQNGL
jgi:hypothetical protein